MGMASDGAPARRLGRFELATELGSGGMGVVFAADDPQLGRRVAVKVLHREVMAGLRGDEARARLLREAQAMARLTHPNVVRVHELARDGDQLFVVMELVLGRSLVEWLRAPRTPAAILDVFAAAGAGLAAAHAAGLVHRDFKPDNVLVAASGEVRVTDFGLACASGEALARDDDRIDPLALAITHTGAIVGTPRYMAPEQFLGQPVAAAADQFGFCVALYAALYGEPPFAGDRYGELMDSVVEGRLREAPAASAVPSAIRAVLVRGLAAAPAARFPSMDALLDALRAARTPGSRTRRLAPALVAASAAAVAAIALMAGAATDRAPVPAVAGCAGCARLIDPAAPAAPIAREVLEVDASPPAARPALIWTTRRDAHAALMLDDGGTRELATPGLEPASPAFSPAGDVIAFASTTAATRGIYIVPRAMGLTERLTEGDDRDPAWLDPTHVVFTRRGADGATAVYVVATTDSAPPTRLAPGRVLDADAEGVLIAAPDGALVRWHAGATRGLGAPAVAWRAAILDRGDVVLVGARAIWRWRPRAAPSEIHRAAPGEVIATAAITHDGRLLVAVKGA
ncbi:MAG: protein kinase [Deltaproteobacteria bacterium]|nr:protein kinase [Deltaproteobacteria bacterium]